MKKEKALNIRKLTLIGILGAVSIVLGLTPLGFIPIGPTRATIMHIPVIIGALMGGPLVGGFVGLIFGLFSIFQNTTNPTPISFVFINPLVSVVPRVLIGITTYYVYRGIKLIGKRNLKGIISLVWLGIIAYLSYGIYTNIVKSQGWLVLLMNIVLILLALIFAYFGRSKIDNDSLEIIIPTIVGTLTNTVGVLFTVYILYAEKFVGKLGLDAGNAKKVILGIGIANGIPETILAIIIVVSVIGILRRNK